jgi:hypothetical protein
VLLKLEPTSDVLGKDFRWLDGAVASDDKALRKRIELLSAFPIDAFLFAVSVAVDDELEL